MRRRNPLPFFALAPFALAADPLLQAVQAETAGFRGRVSVAVVDLGRGRRWKIEPEARYPPASTIKMPISLFVHNLVSEGEAAWDDLLTSTPADYESPGGGAIESAPFYSRYSLRDLVRRRCSAPTTSP